MAIALTANSFLNHLFQEKMTALMTQNNPDKPEPATLRRTTIKPRQTENTIRFIATNPSGILPKKNKAVFLKKNL